MGKMMALRQVKSDAQVCRLGRDNYEWRDWTIMTDGYRVWISKQKIGEQRTDHIEIPKTVFDRLCDYYNKPTPVGRWFNERFVKDR